jgi:hypothetical protein
MTTRKAKPDDEAPADETAEQPAAEPTQVEQMPACGKPHHLPRLAEEGIACQLPAEELDLGQPEHEHRHQDGDAIYLWR